MFLSLLTLFGAGAVSATDTGTSNVPGHAPEIPKNKTLIGIPGEYELMFRLYNPNTGEHFYTASVEEKDHLLKLGWRDESVGWATLRTGQSIYRLYNPNAGDHHYTVSADERDHLVQVGWHDEGIATRTSGHAPIYRLYNPNAKKAGAHHYTRYATERDFLINLGWRDEGIAWYAY